MHAYLNKFLRLLLLAGLSHVALVACHANPVHTPDITGVITPAMISGNPDSFAGKTIRVSGNFSGWKGSCRGPAPATRSDWMIEDGGVCLYVSGPLPAGYSAAPPVQGIGRNITVTGVIERTPDGHPFLRVPR
jgi:hypothetical protein